MANVKFKKYNFISGEKALELAGEGTLLIVVDTHRQIGRAHV